MPERIRLPGISEDSFVSPTDRTALQNLQKVPLLPLLVQKFNELAVDQVLYVLNSSESVHCGPEQFPSLYQMLREACAILDVPQPELYLRRGKEENAYTAGVKRTFIVLNSELVDHFDDAEILYVLGHELGHVKCGHVLYQMMARLLMPLLESAGQATFGVGKLAGIGLVNAFYEWMRHAEFTCDRAGLLVCQDPEAAFRAIMKLGAGGSRFSTEMNVKAFLQQAREYSEAGGIEGVAKALVFFFYQSQLSHPQVVARARALEQWVATGEFDRILAGEYMQDTRGPGWVDPDGGRTAAAGRGSSSRSAGKPGPLGVIPCPACGELVSPLVSACRQCGAPLPGEEGV